MTDIPVRRRADIPGANGLEPEPYLDSSNLETLTDICARELVEAFGLDVGSRLSNVLYPAARRVARSVARDAARYDRIVGESGLRAGGTWAMERICRTSEASGGGNVPQDGPLLIVANHPGLSDTVALFSAISRGDLRIIAARRDLLDALPNTAGHLFSLDDENDGSTELGVIRQAARHMKRGGALLTFPGGRIEPDPAISPHAARELAGWSESFDLFARLVPGLRVVPAVVGGVTSKRALHNPIPYIRRGEAERRWLAATLQMMLPALHPTDVKVAFGEPLAAADYIGIGKHRNGTLPGDVFGAMRRLMPDA